MSLPYALPIFTSDDYLSLERASEFRHEYLDGLVYPMTGESIEHSTICFNLAVSVGLQLRDTPCRGYSPNMKVRTDQGKLYAYPDLAVVCGEPTHHDERRDVLTNPTAIFEVLSPSTAAYDRGEQSLRYRTQIASLQDYVLIAQDRPRVERFSRQPDGVWSRAEVTGWRKLFRFLLSPATSRSQTCTAALTSSSNNSTIARANSPAPHETARTKDNHFVGFGSCGFV